jgi:hypothetical protein
MGSKSAGNVRGGCTRRTFWRWVNFFDVRANQVASAAHSASNNLETSSNKQPVTRLAGNKGASNHAVTMPFKMIKSSFKPALFNAETVTKEDDGSTTAAVVLLGEISFSH